MTFIFFNYWNFFNFQNCFESFLIYTYNIHCCTLFGREKKKKKWSLRKDVDLGTEGASHPRLLHVRVYLMSPLSTLLSASYRIALLAASAKFNFCSLWTSLPKLIYSTAKKLESMSKISFSWYFVPVHTG